jgi:hypothetical protein
VKDTLGLLTGELNSWFEKETDCILWYRKSALTAAIADANIHLNQAVTGLSIHVKGACYDADPAVSAAAERLHIMLKSYGRIIRQPYLQKAGSVKAVLQHLDGDLSAEMETAHLTAWTTTVRNALDAFNRLIEQREAWTLLKPEKRFPAVRRGIEGIWRQIVMPVDSGAALRQSPDYGTLIDRLNPEIDYLNGEFHLIKYSIAHAEPAPVERQAYTGQPLTPTPCVLYTTLRYGTIILELGKDYDLSFKNNVEAGNARCIIRGKGKYRGNKTVTFIIEH